MKLANMPSWQTKIGWTTANEIPHLCNIRNTFLWCWNGIYDISDLINTFPRDVKVNFKYTNSSNFTHA